MLKDNEETLVAKLEIMNNKIDEIKTEQTKLKTLLEKNNKTLMQRINKLQDYNEINDMRSQYLNNEVIKVEHKIEELYY